MNSSMRLRFSSTTIEVPNTRIDPMTAMIEDALCKPRSHGFIV